MVIILFGSSCATIVNQHDTQLTIKTVPREAAVTITNKKGKEVFKGESPAVTILKSTDKYLKRASYLVKITMPGYEEQIIPVRFKLNKWYSYNWLLGGIIGYLVVDPLIGAMFTLETTYIKAVLVRSKSATEILALKIMDIAQVPHELKDKLVRIK
jgi:hypothetical protein